MGKYLKIGWLVAIYILALSVIDVIVVLIWGLNTGQTVTLNMYCWLLFTVGQVGYQIWKRRTRKPREELSFGRPKKTLTEGVTWENPWDKEDRTPVSLFDPAPDAQPVQTWSEEKKCWVVIHPSDCMCQQCYYLKRPFDSVWVENKRRTTEEDASLWNEDDNSW